ncbi:hypothetical protein Patl1_19267 [Pistacia atlantica]|uniref:Uncharacterized protein n=1 Tax=Pistacia atlantica TaxID=434234 RepID=A0ACC1C0Y8_9ROSI|nr:hypothetical protein Patl1_19267 [Pistacia atlantica]
MAGREVREYTNLSDPKDKKWGKGKDKIDDEDITFQRMVAKREEKLRLCGILASYWVVDVSRCKRLLENVAAIFMAEAVNPFDLFRYSMCSTVCRVVLSMVCLRFVYAALDSDDLLYLKEQMEAEEDAERLLRRTEKRAFAAFKISFHVPVWRKIFNLPLNL